MANTTEKVGTNDLLQENAAKILATKRLFEIHRIDPSLSIGAAQARETIIISNFVYLTDGGAMSEDDYFALFQKCENSGDFFELAKKTREHSIGAAKKYLNDNPNLHQSGDATNPGKGNIKSSLHILDGEVEGLSNVHKQGDKVPVYNIGGPAIHEKPDWLLVLIEKLSEPGMRISTVYQMLEGGKIAADTPVDGQADKTEIDAMGVLRSKG